LPVPAQCKISRCIIDPVQIHYLRFILEAYEGIAVLSTIDRKMGLVQISAAPGCESDLDSILFQERDFLRLRPVDDDSPR
jgi:hypothetical protein